jgi:hypothetical protein
MEAFSQRKQYEVNLPGSIFMAFKLIRSFSIQLDNPHLDFLADVEELGRLLHMLLIELRNVTQTFDSLFQFDEGAEVGHADHLPFTTSPIW